MPFQHFGSVPGSSGSLLKGIRQLLAHVPYIVDQAQLYERFPPEHNVRAAEKRCSPAILPLLDRAVEEFGVVTEGVTRGDVVEILRCLHERYAVIFEVSKHTIQDLGLGDLIGI